MSLDGKVAFITGAGQRQERSHLVPLARSGTDIIALDIWSDSDTVPYPDGVGIGPGINRLTRRVPAGSAALAPTRTAPPVPLGRAPRGRTHTP